MEGKPSDTPYDDIKQRLVASHQLSDFQKAERLFQMPALGGRKPSELMAAMLETCPRGEEKTNLFACIFLQRLPREIRVLLAKADHKEARLAAGLCIKYWRYGEAASSCEQPCSWQGNGGAGGNYTRSFLASYSTSQTA